MSSKSFDHGNSDDIERQEVTSTGIPERSTIFERVSFVSYFSLRYPRCKRFLVCLCNAVVTVLLIFIIVFSVCNTVI